MFAGRNSIVERLEVTMVREVVEGGIRMWPCTGLL